MASLTDYHRRHLLHCFVAIEERLEGLEALIVRSQASSPLSPLVKDLSPTECRVIRDHITRIRSAMTAHLNDLGIALDIRRKSLRWSVETSLIHIQTTVDDMGPSQMAGYGPLDASAATIVVRIQDDLTRLLDHACAQVRQGPGGEAALRDRDPGRERMGDS